MKGRKRGLFICITVLILIVSVLYFVEGTSLVRDATWGQNLTNVRFTALAVGDLDNDGIQEVVLTGCLNDGADDCENGAIAKVYSNNGSALAHNLSWSQNLTGIGHGSVAFGDLDNDGKLDLVLTGCTTARDYVCSNNPLLKIYMNNGTSLIENQTWQQNLTGIYKGSTRLADINNDGRLDLVLMGSTSGSQIAKVYVNNGSTLTENTMWQQGLTALEKGDIDVGDIDNDGDLDMVAMGEDLTDTAQADVYLNNGTSLNQIAQWEQDVTPATLSSLSLGDFDNDGDLDLIIMGIGDHLLLFGNNGTAFIINQTDASGGGLFIGMYKGSLGWGDYDNDGDLDLVAIGREETYDRVYRNNNTLFEIDASASIDIKSDDFSQGSLVFIDLNNDTKLDMIAAGAGYTAGIISRAYINNGTTNNSIPYTPSTFQNYSLANGDIFFGWNNGSDNETPSKGLYYNLKIGTSSGSNDIVSSVFGGSNGGAGGGGGGANGYFGNMMQRRNITLDGSRFQVGTTYYWSVQTIDTGLAKGAWSTEQTFNLTSDFTPPVNTMNAPMDSLVTNGTTITFNATVYDAQNLSNVSLYGNWSGGWHSNETNSSGINNTDYIFNKTLPERQYQWGIRSCDVNANCYGANRTFRIDTTNPQLKLMAPTNASSWTTSNTIKFNYNVTDLAINNCSLLVNGVVNYTNTSITLNVTQNFTSVLPNGRYNWSVRCTDAANNINASYNYSLTVNYQADDGNGDTTSSSGGGGGGGGTTTTTAKVSRLVPTIVEGENKIEFTESEKESVGVEEIVINTKKEAVNVKISIEKIESKPSEVETAPSGSTYTYLKIDKTNLQDEDIKEAKIKFIVNKTWMTKNNYEKDKISLNRYNPKWEKLPTSYVKGDNKLYYYESTTPSFSYFAVTVEEEAPQAEEKEEIISGEEEEAPEEPTPQPQEGILKEQEGKRNLIWLWIVLGILAVAIAVTLVIMKQKRRAAKKKH